MIAPRKGQTKKLGFKYLPCLRCGRFLVAFLAPVAFDDLDRGDLTCKRCCVPHYLKIRKRDGHWLIQYDRDTRRYPAEFYDEAPFVLLKAKDVDLKANPGEDAPFPTCGPIWVFKRRRLSATEVKEVWLRSKKRCHICRRIWKLDERGQRGWHIDHVVPNSGGGKDTETMPNFLVACAKCNLRKGRGYTSRTIQRALLSLLP